MMYRMTLKGIQGIWPEKLRKTTVTLSWVQWLVVPVSNVYKENVRVDIFSLKYRSVGTKTRKVGMC
jgi:hypothetical protein